MKKIELICIGNLKFKELKLLEENFIKKINFFVDFKVKNLKEIKLKNENILMEKEGKMILESLNVKDFVIALDENGKKMNSMGFAKFLSDKISFYSGRTVFLIGGFAGLSKILDDRIDFKLSFSDMTFSHDLFRIVFLEQLYRVFTIIKGIKYHR
jgi:23S rRNA (pseudouridine1915-N3)-methyltransferase